MVHLQSRLDITKIFCDLDDFCKVFESTWKQAHLPQMGGEKLSRCRMCLSEIMTIAIAFHGSGYRTFKEFYTLHVLPYWNNAFPNLVSYNRFVEVMPWSLMALCCYLLELLLKLHINTPLVVFNLNTKIMIAKSAS